MALVAYDDVAKVRNLAIVNRIDIAIAALNIYEYIITFELERKRIWQRKWSWVKWIFMVNRYLAVAYSISMILLLSIATEALSSNKSSFFNSVELPHTTSSTVCHLSATRPSAGCLVTAFSSLRIRALWPNESIFWPVVVFLLYVVPFGTDIWDYFSLKAMSPISLFGCAPQAGTNNTAIVWREWISMNVGYSPADIPHASGPMQPALTNANRLEMAKLGFSTSLTFLLLRDGTISFCVLLTLNIIQILMSAAPSWSNFSAVNEFVHWPALFPIVISRFLLDLRQFNERVDPDDGASMSLSHIDSDLHLDMSNCTLGDLGEPMNFDKSGSKDLL
ncbi:hypothetical protein BC835DRAFT_1411083 [Cytidiella melzeri]|nr:hypothetical protein BC835DRAFT_1411083 [Cytidiella melzeri]